jgi:uncharacterized membrane-anchored protein YitT (DUF2179 family)
MSARTLEKIIEQKNRYPHTLKDFALVTVFVGLGVMGLGTLLVGLRVLGLGVMGLEVMGLEVAG